MRWGLWTEQTGTGRGGGQEGRETARGYCASVRIVPLQTKSRFRASDIDLTLVKSFPTVCSVLEMLMLLIITFVHLKNFENAVIVSKLNVIGIIFLNVQNVCGCISLLKVG